MVYNITFLGPNSEHFYMNPSLTIETEAVDVKCARFTTTIFDLMLSNTICYVLNSMNNPCNTFCLKCKLSQTNHWL